MLKILLANYYSQNNIFQANQNNYKLPADGKFVIITRLHTKSEAYPASKISGTLPSGSRQTENINTTWFQFDFYGTPAESMCEKTRLYMQSQDGTNYLMSQTPSCSLYNIDEMMNLTEALDQDRYLSRFTFKFSLFNILSIQYQQYAFGSVNPGLIYVP